MATRIAKAEARAAPLQIRSQSLRHWQDFAPAGPLPGLSALPEKDASGLTGTWRQADVKRAIAAAEQAGLTDYRVEMAPDGTITIVVGPGEAAKR